MDFIVVRHQLELHSVVVSSLAVDDILKQEFGEVADIQESKVLETLDNVIGNRLLTRIRPSVQKYLVLL